MFRASPYKLKMFETCPQQYKFTYVDHLSDQYKTAKPYLTMGAHVHNALKDFYDNLEPKERTYKNLEKILRKRWLENRNGFAGVEDERRWGTKALMMLKVYVHKNDMATTPAMLEDYFDTDVSEDVKVLGRIDRVDEEQGGYHVIDYKTGKFNAEDLSELQLILYAMIMAGNMKTNIHKASYLYLPENKWHSIEISPEMYEEAGNMVLEQVELIKQEKEFLPCMNKYCKSCDFLEICPKKEEIKESLDQPGIDKNYG
ncbi:PD-(D/E)XK nuclease family protein [Patescibacteria group bacterium]|nr:PD-(D/E)XK nuclease family protein [Patescibacteria group bacterium]MBU1673317.1 PD-(D/E)XK nuclease family protein [Patescibacteria group bacterium]MBU1963564.1 PD-(D/E)XK nuclease family protein [Patescibacteria group bacterium]